MVLQIDGSHVLELDERVAQDVMRHYKDLEDSGKLPSRQELATYYRTFRNKFGPEQLASLDGETLLNTMHSHGTTDSLVYWIEFKNDDELPAIFGSISGGSAYKFGLFRRKESGVWITGTPQAPKEISVEEAIVLARQHRDDLIRGCELLDHLPEHADLAAYERLQQDMSRLASSVYNSAWGHKYFSLLYPDKIDDFHSPEYARFHLIKLLLAPPATDGRYITAAYYVAIAHQLQIPVHNLTKVLNERDGRNLHNYWRIGTSGYDDGAPKEGWPAMRDGNCCAIGWSPVGDLSSLTKDDAGVQALVQKLQASYPDRTSAVIGKFRRQLFDFRHNIAIGDLILACDGVTVLGIGQVIGTYEYAAGEKFPHRLPVEWLSIEEWKLSMQNGSFEGKLISVYKMKQPENLINAEKYILEEDKSDGNPPSPKPPITGNQPPEPPKPLPLLTGLMARIQATLARKGQVILYGPPGTGKTYWAESTARELAARSCFKLPFADLTPEQKLTIIGDSQELAGHVRICCFHPAYGYEDFLEGFRPDTANGQMQFAPRAGLFKQLCHDAAQQPKENFYLIIDEINRGDIPRIFGELLLVLEKDKRGKSILLPLTRQQFQVPPNVFILGTMNTADRSIALLDTALRRRFGFIELLPDSSALKKAEVSGIPLGLWLEALNSRICQHVGRDARNLQIGHAYLMEKGLPIEDLAILARVIQDDILPLLEEYCYEDYARLEKIMGSGLIDAKAQVVRHELFEPAQQDGLVQALLAPSPEILTSAQAIAIEEQQAALNEAEENDASLENLEDGEAEQNDGQAQ
ncbi:AAA family ATPase [Dictyobacter kobayashii]|uniref:AAA+ ATPase domain-containing protein n=1 Tax=Dictyobacter kobayashii TaxID=2014872 RepID=A0A402AWS9_9CHLR|nr:AAA family ATPase [Dictyobacter kobayashii]GCE23610.1 hypothetical protein KDK_74100 [Dictyobacter kobayashii]